MNTREANDVNVVLHWAMGHVVTRPGGELVTDEWATAAAKRLAAGAEKTLMAGLGPDDVQLVRQLGFAVADEDVRAGDPHGGEGLDSWDV